MTLDIAFKEWAVICAALATGRQTLILRKGGIAETGGEFRPEHARFWLYPTLAHQQEAGVKPELAALFASGSADHPGTGQVRLSHFAEVTDVRHFDDLSAVQRLDDRHGWSAATVEQRFHYKRPGLFALAVRVWSAEPQIVTETPAYAGCKSWVELTEPLAVTNVVPVLSDADFAARCSALN